MAPADRPTPGWIRKVLPFWRLAVALCEIKDALGRIEHRLNVVQNQGRSIMSAADDLKAIITRMDTATTNIAADVRAIKDSVRVGMTPAEVAEVTTAAEAVATRLEGLDAENPEGQV